MLEGGTAEHGQCVTAFKLALGQDSDKKAHSSYANKTICMVVGPCMLDLRLEKCCRNIGNDCMPILISLAVSILKIEA